MRYSHLGHVIFLASCLFAPFSSAWSKAEKKVLLKDVQALTLRKDRKTTHRRVAAVPQLKCAGGNGCRYHQVEVMRCENAGTDYDEGAIQWTCKADVPEYFKLGSTDVMCEGYTSSKDPFILKGSCGVEYRLLLTEKGEAKYGYSSTSAHSSSAFTNTLFWLLFLGVAGWMLYTFARSFANNPRIPRAATNRWSGGGGGGNDDDDPPPPYSPQPPRKKTTYKPRASTTNEGWRPGFWTGLAAGAAGSMLAGSRSNDRTRGQTYQRQPSPPTSWWSSNRQSNNAGGRWTSQDDNAGEGSSSGTTRYTSTGFGGTSNR